MIHPWLVINDLILFLFASMYLGTGWSLVLFSFPTASKLTPDNYYAQFVPQVTAATKFFTVMTTLMLAANVIMIVGDSSHFYWFLPAVVMAAVIVATAFTLLSIIPDNRKMDAGIKTQAELDAVLGDWILKNWIRVGLWTVEWAAMAAWFGLELTR